MISGKNFADQGVKLLMTGMWAFVILLFTGVCYKFFVVSMIVMYIFMFGVGMPLEIGLHFLSQRDSFITGGYCGRYCTGSDRRSDTVWTYEAVL